jgi:hypothetical protein
MFAKVIVKAVFIILYDILPKKIVVKYPAGYLVSGPYWIPVSSIRLLN